MNQVTTGADVPWGARSELTDDQLDRVSGGNQISLFPSPHTPKFGPAGSIAQGELNSNQTDDNLP